MSGLNRGSIYLSGTGAEARITLIRLQAGMIQIHAELHGPARVPAGAYTSTVYGEDGLQIAAIPSSCEEERVIQRGEHLDLIATLAVGSVESGTVPVS